MDGKCGGYTTKCGGYTTLQVTTMSNLNLSCIELELMLGFDKFQLYMIF